MGRWGMRGKVGLPHRTPPPQHCEISLSMQQSLLPHFHGNKLTHCVSPLYVQLQAQPSGQTPPPPFSVAPGRKGAQQCRG